MRRLHVTLVLTAGLCLGLAPGASAKTTCAYKAASDRLEIEMSKGGDLAHISVEAPDILVRKGFAPPIDCGGAAATVGNTDRITVDDTSTRGSTKVQLFGAASFAPGASDAGGDAGAGANRKLRIGDALRPQALRHRLPVVGGIANAEALEGLIV